MQEIGKSAFKDMGLSQSDFLATATKWVLYFKARVLGFKNSLNLSSKAMQRAADVASIMGIDTSAAMELLQGRQRATSP